MVKVATHMGRIKLDDEVAQLVKRIGTDESSIKYITEYTISRIAGGPAIVTVTFIADEHFSQVAATEKETKNV